MSYFVKGNIKESLSLSGNVDIKIKNNDMIVDSINVHNNSEIGLFRFIRSAMCGRSNINQLPGKILPLDVNGRALIGDGIESLIPIEDSNESETMAWVTIPFLIPNSVLSAGTQIGGFELYSFEKSRVKYATVKLDEPIDVEPNTNIELEWKLIIKLPEEKEQGE